ncbi:MAG: hypothetical protein SH847_05975 [Roseiflexaceae bacterium]|mgnify:CR=1 FL=1|nr:hypothetical protein [Roseiflexaceae bacterium]
MTTTTTIRVSVQTRNLLHTIADHTGLSMQAVLEAALEQYRRQQVIAATNAAYAQFQADPQALADWDAEQRGWDQTIADGLEDA